MSRFGPRDGGDRTVLPASELGLDVPADVPRVDYVVTETNGETFKLDSTTFEPITVQPGKVGVWPVMTEARTVLPGHPVRYHDPICIGSPIEVLTDPSKLVGVLTYQPQPNTPKTDAELFDDLRAAVASYIPDPSYDKAYRRERDELLAFVDRCAAALKRVDVIKAQRLTCAETATLKQALNAASLTPDPERASQLLTDEQRIKLEAAIDRAAIQPTECNHEHWEWPMQRCPDCGTESIHP